jgi:FtsP/CotA-like multicopper oxidase with cupredoxin domain
MIHRRDFMRMGLAAGSALLWSRRLRAQDNPWAAMADYGKVRPPTFDRPLPIPPVLAPARTEAGADVYEIATRPGVAQPLPGPPTPIWGYQGTWPGPTIRVTRGRPARVRLTNLLPEDVSVHNHGHKSAADSDGHPLDIIRKDAVKEYVYPNDQTGGTYWYHDHTMGVTGAHVAMGLAGFYIIDDPAEQALGLPTGAEDIAIVLQDRVFHADNSIDYVINAGTIFTGYIGNTLCANGVHTPYLEVAARRYRFRFLNGANARNLRLALDDGGPLVQIGSDGSLLAAPVVQRAVAIAPAERCDCIIDFSRYPVGTKVVLKNLDPTWPVLPDVLRFEVKRSEADSSRVPDALLAIPRLEPRTARATRHVRFQLADGRWTLNGLRYDPARIDFRPRLGTVEVWELRNLEATQMHPFHQHVVPFQVLDVNGAPPPPELRGWKDTVAVGPSATVRIIMRFVATPGVYVFHCHKLEHEDHAMMLQQQLV